MASTDKTAAGDLRATYTNHAHPWALIRRGSSGEGKRASTRMAILVDTVVGPDGKAVALRGYIGREDMTGWTGSLRRIEWSEVVRVWQAQPTPAAVRGVKRRQPKTASGA